MAIRTLLGFPAFALTVLVASSCQRTTDGESAVPHYDNHPPAQAANGDVIGADNKSPQALLAEQGTTSHPAPGWKIDKNGIAYDPKRQPEEGTGATRIPQPHAAASVVVPPATAPAPAPVPQR
jgi:hypothetical protein